MTNKKPSADEPAKPASPAASPSPDIALIHGVTPDGEGLHILRARDNRVELGALRPLREGAPITGEVVTLRPRPNTPALCDVEVHVKAPQLPATDDRQVPRAALSHPGPAQVATEDYRRNWDAIWSRPAQKSKLVN